MSENESGITKDTKHVHVGFLGPERILPDEIYIAQLVNRQEGTVNYQFTFRRQAEDNCEMDVIKRLYPEFLHRITLDQYLKISTEGKLKEVLQELSLWI